MWMKARETGKAYAWDGIAEFLIKANRQLRKRSMQTK